MEQQNTVLTALISVSDKTGIVELSCELINLNWRIISTGGTAKLLHEKSIPVEPVEKTTGFPEILDGRVKTLHPKIFGGILARKNNPQHQQEMQNHQINPIGLVIVNLYPFEETLLKLKGTGDSIAEIIENIDIGGVTLLRAAAKNYNDVLVVCDPEDYPLILTDLRECTFSLELRQRLAAKAFRHTAYYDSIISRWFTPGDKYPEKITLGLQKVHSLRYGENPHQTATVYKSSPATVSESELSLATAKQLQGKELSFNNYLDLDAAVNLVREYSNPACVIIKHNNPCGVAENHDLVTGYQKARLCDPVSAFGGIIALNRIVDENTAREIVKSFVECIIAPGYTDRSREILSVKKDLRLIEATHQIFNTALTGIDLRSISGGMLVQDKDVLLGLDTLKIVTTRYPEETELNSLKFAWRISKYTKSNAIILTRGLQSVGIGAGQMSRIDAVRIAISKMNELDTASPYFTSAPLVLASDAFFPFPDVVEEASKSGVKSIIQPGGSLHDQDSIDICNKLGIAMVFTGVRHFRH